MKKKLLTLALLTVLAAFPAKLYADDDPAAVAAAKENADYCSSTINKDRPTPPDVVIAKVNEACALLTKEGPAAFPKFGGKGSSFIYEGTYVFIQGLADGLQYVHPIQYKMVGTKNVGIKDAKGKRIFAIMSDLVREKGEGWVEYYWPKPGSDDVVHKVTFVKKCTMSNGVEVVVGSGLYHFNDADVAKLDLH